MKFCWISFEVECKSRVLFVDLSRVVKWVVSILQYVTSTIRMYNTNEHMYCIFVPVDRVYWKIVIFYVVVLNIMNNEHCIYMSIYILMYKRKKAGLIMFEYSLNMIFGAWKKLRDVRTIYHRWFLQMIDLCMKRKKDIQIFKKKIIHIYILWKFQWKFLLKNIKFSFWWLI